MGKVVVITGANSIDDAAAKIHERKGYCSFGLQESRKRNSC